MIMTRGLYWKRFLSSFFSSECCSSFPSFHLFLRTFLLLCNFPKVFYLLLSNSSAFWWVSVFFYWFFSFHFRLLLFPLALYFFESLVFFFFRFLVWVLSLLWACVGLLQFVFEDEFVSLVVVLLLVALYGSVSPFIFLKLLLLCLDVSNGYKPLVRFGMAWKGSNGANRGHNEPSGTSSHNSSREPWVRNLIIPEMQELDFHQTFCIPNNLEVHFPRSIDLVLFCSR